MTRHSCADPGLKIDRKARLERLIRELDELLGEEYDGPDDPGTIDDIEEESDRVAEIVRRITADKLLKKKQRNSRPTGSQSCQWTCTCGQAMRYVGMRSRALVLRSGPHTIIRSYFHCKACRRGVCPLDNLLQLRDGQYSPRVAALMVRLNMLFPDRQAAREMHELLGLDPAVSTVQRYSRQAGAKIAAEWRAAEEAWRQNTLPESKKHPKRLVLTMDAVKLHVHSEWHDAKIAAAYELDDGRRAVRTQYTATMATSTEFGKRLPVLAHRAGADHCNDIEVVADGGNWIWQETGKYFPTSVQVLDYYHACEHLWVAARARYGDGTQECKDWAAKLSDLLYAEKQADLRAEIKLWQPHTKEKRAIRRRLFNYLVEHKNRMNYATLKDKGYHIGSGVVEAGCKNVAQIRMKRAGSRWEWAGAEAMLHLCSYGCSEGAYAFRQYV